MMRRTICAVTLLALLLLTACGDGQMKEETTAPGDGAVQPPVSDPADPAPPAGELQPTEDNVPDEGDQGTLLFSQIPAYFCFSSGAGAWSTELTIAEDGSFTGLYNDSDMGSMDEALYPNGTVYTCSFSGRFSEPEMVDEHTYTMRLESLAAEGVEGETVYEDGIRWITSVPYGMENAEEVRLYLPGKPTAELPEEILMWIQTFVGGDMPESLPVFVLHNVSEAYAFVGYV